MCVWGKECSIESNQITEMRKLTLGLYHHPSTKIVPRIEEITVNTHSLSQICITVFWAPSSVQKLGLFDFYSNAERKIIHALNSRLFTNHAFNPDHSVNMKAWNASWLCLSDKGWSCCLYRFGLSLADSVSAYSDPISLLLFTIGKSDCKHGVQSAPLSRLATSRRGGEGTGH